LSWQTQLTSTVVFFFSSRRRHTRLQGDWSSDVCSSDLPVFDALGEVRNAGSYRRTAAMKLMNNAMLAATTAVGAELHAAGVGAEIGRASCRERGEIAVAAGEV